MARAVNLEDKVAFLKQPDVYPDPPAEVETVETHIAWVFLTGEYAYKLRKPAERGDDDLDYSTPEQRLAASEAEVRLNQPLAPGVYLGVVPLIREKAGHLRLGGDGEAVDWLVHTRRLPAERMLDEAIKRKTVDADDVRPAARLLARFYRDAEPLDISTDTIRQRIADEIAENEAELTKREFDLPRDRVVALFANQRCFLNEKRHLIDSRVRERRIVEGHGDLKPEHVCLSDPPVVFDRMEYNRDFRTADPADELALLSYECERLEAPFLGPVFFDVYRATTGDDPPDALVAFYKSCSAALRARIAIKHIGEPMEDAPAQWLGEAKEHLQRAEHYIARACA